MLFDGQDGEGVGLGGGESGDGEGGLAFDCGREGVAEGEERGEEEDGAGGDDDVGGAVWGARA